MLVSNKNILKNFTESFCKIVDRYSDYVIVSGYVAIANGRSRGTEDIDIIVNKCDFDVFSKMIKELKKKFEVLSPGNLSDKEIYEEYLLKKIPIRFCKKNEIIPNMEFKFSKNEIENLAIKTRKKYKNSLSSNIYFSEINLQIAFKEEYLRSNKDIEDSKHLREIFKNEIDNKKIDELKNLIKEVL